MSPEQKNRLRFAFYCPAPLSAATVKRQFAQARKNVERALRGGNLQKGLQGAVFVEACREADRHIVLGVASSALEQVV